MEKNEAILIIGAERYSDYQGYGSTFCWKYRQRDVFSQRLVYCELGGEGLVNQKPILGPFLLFFYFKEIFENPTRLFSRHVPSILQT